jgi:4a-hydroxytetrahydrobiopterin dehydratase
MGKLADQKCKACNKDTPPLKPDAEERLHQEVPEWELEDHKLHREFHFKDFPTSMKFANEMARISESEGHHPIFTVNLRDVDVTLWTHAIDALSENDFIVAAKYDRAAATL